MQPFASEQEAVLHLVRVSLEQVNHLEDQGGMLAEEITPGLVSIPAP
jgi:hypothetical protein